MEEFKVLIVGGSVAGMGLAIMLEKYGIKYELLEKHSIIAPQLGASIAMLPNGLRILEQIGCAEAVKSQSSPMNRANTFDPEGHRIKILPDLGAFLEEATGYKMVFMDRKDLIQILFDNLKDKSKVCTSKEVVSVKVTQSNVVVKTKDGATHTGSILVGADGVHSRVRSELWRIADAETQGFIREQDKSAITCRYSCIFGISQDVPSIVEDWTYRTLKNHRMYLYQGGPQGKAYWFAFFKNTERTTGGNIPRYTIDQENELGEKYADDVLFQGFTFGDIRRKRLTSVLVPLEEFVLEKCFYRRIVLVGDSFHKLHPLTGFGGNCALESASYLADQLRELPKKENALQQSETIERIFLNYQQNRVPRADLLMRQAHDQQRMESLDTPILKFAATNILGRLAQEQILQLIVDQTQLGTALQHLPPPTQQGVVPFADEVKIIPGHRPLVATLSWIILLVTTAAVPLFYYGSPYLTAMSTPLNSRHVWATLTTAMNSLYVVETNRRFFGMTALASALPFTLASVLFGWANVAPAFCVLYISLSRHTAFYFPSPRGIDPLVAQSIPMSLVAAYSIPTLRTIRCLFTIHDDDRDRLLFLWQMSHLAFPVLVIICAKLFSWAESSRKPRKYSAEYWYGNLDITYLRVFQANVSLMTAVIHLWVLTTSLGKPFGPMPTATSIESLSLTFTITTWCLYTVWDLCRVNILDIPVGLGWIGIVISGVIFGPAATLAGTWLFREQALENSRVRLNYSLIDKKTGWRKWQ